LIESARLRFEHEEYPLALQKIEEILQLEPGNSQALGLKMSIENKLTNTKVDEWYRLAQQHIENQSFVHAREALRKVLELKPAETRAAQMPSPRWTASNRSTCESAPRRTRCSSPPRWPGARAR